MARALLFGVLAVSLLGSTATSALSAIEALTGFAGGPEVVAQHPHPAVAITKPCDLPEVEVAAMRRQPGRTVVSKATSSSPVRAPGTAAKRHRWYHPRRCAAGPRRSRCNDDEPH
jgi:hypothetical protein